MKAMSDFGIFASRFQVNNETLEEFENSIRGFRMRRDSIANNEKHVQVVHDVLTSITQSINGKLSNSLQFENKNVAEILRKRKMRVWPIYKKEIITLHDKFASKKFALSEQEIKILNDIADAMDIECSKLFNRMRRFL